MGITIHFVDPETLMMVSSALACRHFKGTHTGEKIGQMLASVFAEFNIESKVQNVVFQTDESMQEQEVPEEETSVLNTADCLESEAAEAQSDNASDNGVMLPPHKHCGNHSLNLID